MTNTLSVADNSVFLDGLTTWQRSPHWMLTVGLIRLADLNYKRRTYMNKSLW